MRHGTPNRLTGLLGTQRAVLSAPMAKVAGGRLAAAVTRGGGMGFIGGGYGDRQWIADEAANARNCAVGIGLITWTMTEGLLDAVLGHQPRAVWLSFGDPRPHIPVIHDAGAVVVCQIGTLAEAVHAHESGADILVAQGSGAGGHGRMAQSLIGLVPAIRTRLPDAVIVAAGGLIDISGHHAAVALGADGVALGTRYYATHEALDSDAAKRRLIAATGDDTVVSTVYDHVRGPVWPAEYAERTLRTPLTDRWKGREAEIAGLVDQLRAEHDYAVEHDDMTKRVVFAGDGVGAVRSVESAEDVTRTFPGAEPH